MEKEFQEILLKKQETEQLNLQSPSPYRKDKISAGSSGKYAQKILNQCRQSQERERLWHFGYTFAFVFTILVSLLTIANILRIWSGVSISQISSKNIQTPVTLAENAMDNGDYEKAHILLDQFLTEYPDSPAAVLAYSNLYELEEQYDQAAELLISYIDTYYLPYNITDGNLFYQELKEISGSFSEDTQTAYDKCINDCAESAALFSSIDLLIEHKQYQTALELCDSQKRKGCFDSLLFEYYHTCYIELKEYELYADYLIEQATEIQTHEDYTLGLPVKSEVISRIEEIYPFVSSEIQNKIDALDLL